MRKMTTVVVIGVLAVGVGALTFVKGAAAETTVVEVNGEKITEQAVAAETERQIRMQSAQMPAEMEITEDMRNQVRHGVVDQMVQETLVEQILAEEDIEVDDERVDRQIETLAAQQNLTMEQVQAQIAQAGMTMDELKEQIKKSMQLEALVDQKMADAPIDEETVRAFYDQNPQHFEEPEQVRAAHVLIVTQDKSEAEQAEARQQIEEVLQKAKAGEDFGDLAQQYSEDPGSRDQGGQYTFPRGQMVPEFEEVAFTMQPGQISDIVETMYGYHVIKKLEHIDGEKQSFDEVKDMIEEHLTQQQRGQFFQQYLAQKQQEADIEYSAAEQQRRQAVEQQMQRQQEMMQQMQMQQQQQQQQR